MWTGLLKFTVFEAVFEVDLEVGTKFNSQIADQFSYLHCACLETAALVKVKVLTFNVLTSLSPEYLLEHMLLYIPAHQLMSLPQALLYILSLPEARQFVSRNRTLSEVGCISQSYLPEAGRMNRQGRSFCKLEKCPRLAEKSQI